MLARRLDESSAIEVKEAQSGDLLLAGRVLICPGNRHMKVRPYGARRRRGARRPTTDQWPIGPRWTSYFNPSQLNLVASPLQFS